MRLSLGVNLGQFGRAVELQASALGTRIGRGTGAFFAPLNEFLEQTARSAQDPVRLRQTEFEETLRAIRVNRRERLRAFVEAQRQNNVLVRGARRLGLAISESGNRWRDFRRLGRSAANTVRLAMFNLRVAIQRAGRSVQRMLGTFLLLRTALLAFAAVSALGRLVRDSVVFADRITDAQNALRSAGNAAESVGVQFGTIARNASDIRAAIFDTANLTGRLQQFANFNFADAAQSALTLQQAIQVGGTTRQESTGAIRQLIQGLAAGQLRGQELNSVLEQMPVVARLIANELGVLPGQLRTIAQDGRITGAVVRSALLNNAEQINEQWQALEPTFRSAWDTFAEGLGVGLSGLGRFLTQSTGLSNFLVRTGQAFTRLGTQTSPDWVVNIRRELERVNAELDRYRRISGTTRFAFEGNRNVRELLEERRELVRERNRRSQEVASIGRVGPGGQPIIPGAAGFVGVSLANQERSQRERARSLLEENRAVLQGNATRQQAIQFAREQIAAENALEAANTSLLRSFNEILGGTNTYRDAIGRLTEAQAESLQTILAATQEDPHAARRAELATERQQRGFLRSIGEGINARQAADLRREAAAATGAGGSLGLLRTGLQINPTAIGADFNRQLAEGLQQRVQEPGAFVGVARDFVSSFQGSVRQAVTSGNFDNLGQAIVAAITGSAFDALFRSASGLLAGQGGILGAIFGGGRQSGGPTRAGSIYAVNEGTPNTEFIRSRGGDVLTNEQGRRALGGAGTTVINVTPNTPEQFRELLYRYADDVQGIANTGLGEAA